MKEKNTKKMIKKIITFTPRMSEMVTDIKESQGYMSFAAVVHAAIISMHTKTFPNYSRPFAGETGVERIKRKAEEKKAKEDIERESQIEIMNRLEGELINKNGQEYVLYYTYSRKKRYPQNVPLTMLSNDLVKTQYFPSKDVVKKLQESGQTDYA